MAPGGQEVARCTMTMKRIAIKMSEMSVTLSKPIQFVLISITLTPLHDVWKNEVHVNALSVEDPDYSRVNLYCSQGAIWCTA